MTRFLVGLGVGWVLFAFLLLVCLALLDHWGLWDFGWFDRKAARTWVRRLYRAEKRRSRQPRRAGVR
jgi:hypothetical protein